MNNLYRDRINNHKRFYSRRKNLRNGATPEEVLLWDFLKGSKLGFKFRRQHSVGGYILDFYCPEKKLAIELDGKHHSYQIDYDTTRDDYLKSFGIQILRFPNEQITYFIKDVIKIILINLHS